MNKKLFSALKAGMAEAIAHAKAATEAMEEAFDAACIVEARLEKGDPVPFERTLGKHGPRSRRAKRQSSTKKNR